MPSSTRSRKSAAGGGSIRKKCVTRNGKEYMYWEARVSVGFDPGTGKQIGRQFTAIFRQSDLRQIFTPPKRAYTKRNGTLWQFYLF